MMTDREKLVELVKEICNKVVKACGCSDMLPSYSFCKNAVYESIADYLIINGVTVAEMQRPLTLEEVKENRAVWIEDDGCETGQELYPALYYAEGYPQHTVFTYLDEDLGEEDAWLNNTQYGITWRCWATKPTEEERANAEWEEGVNDGD